jgi:ferredoxin
MRTTITVKSETCKVCGLCAEVCPNKILVKNKSKGTYAREDRKDLCIRCGQCMAVCPTKSIRVSGLSYRKNFFPLPEQTAGGDGFFNLIASRRAIRNFKAEPVSRELLEKIVEAISFAPPGFTPIKTEITVVSDPQLVKKALPHMISFYDTLVNVIDDPKIRSRIRREVGRQRFKTMKTHLIPLLRSRLPELKKGVEDTLTRYAPAMILFHSNRKKEDIREDIIIAATYGMLAAHALGLGGSIMDIIPPAVDKTDELRKMFKIPETNQVISSIIIGHPKYKYQRGIRRNLKSVEWL